MTLTTGSAGQTGVGCRCAGLAADFLLLISCRSANTPAEPAGRRRPSGPLANGRQVEDWGYRVNQVAGHIASERTMKRADLRGGRNQPVPGCHPRSDRIMPRQVQSREQSGEQDPLSGASTSSSGS